MSLTAPRLSRDWRDVSEKRLDSHEIRHALAAAVGEQMWYMAKEGCPFDSQRYLHDVQRLYAEFIEAKS